MFDKYKIPQEPIMVDEAVEVLKDNLRKKQLSVVNFLKAFPRKKRLDMVDVLRGAMPIPLDFKELSMIGQVLDLSTEEIYAIWENRVKQVLESSGMNIYSNAALVNSMFDCAKKYIDLKENN